MRRTYVDACSVVAWLNLLRSLDFEHSISEEEEGFSRYIRTLL
jgi:hypothetical protein